jgi:hypothetical protein
MTNDHKFNALAYVRAQIDMLSEQTDDLERRAFKDRAHGGLFALHAAGLFTVEELMAIGQEIDAANNKARLLVRAHR